MKFLDDVSRALTDGVLHTDPDIVEAYRYDRTTWIEPGTPIGVVLPQNTQEVVEIVKAAAKHNVPLVPRGAGSSLCGGSQAIDGTLTIAFDKMNSVLDIDPQNQLIRVEPALLNADITRATAPHGLFYPPDPASKEFCSIGGNIATNAGGLCCVKYGVTRNYVQRLEVVMADGTVIETGQDTVKGVQGLDMTGLIVGSEGTLGLVTKATLRLAPLSDGVATMVAFFDKVSDAGDAVAAITARGIGVSLLEIMDRATVAVVDDYTKMGLDRSAEALLIAQSDAAAPLRRIHVEQAAEACDASGATYVTFTEDPDESEALLQARRLAGPAIEELGEAIWDDVGVPRSRIPDIIRDISAIAEREQIEIFTFGHAGDGNMHPTILARREDPDSLRRALRAFDAIVEAALNLGGVITGEHGVGKIKAPFLSRAIGANNLAVQQRIKHALDPQNILNPGRWL